MSKFIGILGIILIFGLAFLLSNNRKAINYKTIGVGFLLQVFFAVFIFKIPLGEKLFMAIGLFIRKLLVFAKEGGTFVFGGLMSDKFTQIFTGSGGSIFALQLISSMILMMILVNMLYYYGIMQRVVAVLGKGMNKIMDVSGAEALSNVASSFVGQVVAQLMIKPYLANLTRSEMLASMSGSMACVSGAIMPIYIAMGIPAQYVLASCVMAAPGALVISKIVYPEIGKPETMSDIKVSNSRTHSNVFDSIASAQYNNVKKRNPPVEGLGRAPGAKRQPRVDKPAETTDDDSECYSVIELAPHGKTYRVGRTRAFILQGDASEIYDTACHSYPGSVWVMIKGIGPLHGESYKLSSGE